MSKNTNLSEKQLLLPIINENKSPLCACGFCNLRVTWNKDKKKWNKYVKQHHAKAKWASPEYKDKMSKIRKATWQDSELRDNQSRLMKERWENPKFRDNLSKQRKSMWEDIEFRENHSKRMVEQWKDPKFRESMSKQRQSMWQDAELRKSASKRMIKYWQDPEYIAKRFASCKSSPNVPESLLIALTPESVKYVGNGKWWRTLKVMTDDGVVTRYKNPDFLVKGQKKVIEFYGDYFHRNDYPDEVWHEAWAKAGYECLIIHEHELKDIDSVLTRIGEFIGQEQWQLEFSLVGG